MLQRNITEYLSKWSTKTNRKPLILRGARQVGKSFSVRHFAKTNSLELFEFNFEKNPEDSDIFLNNPKEALKLIELKSGKKIIEDSSLIFLDEIQIKPEIFSKLRYWYEDHKNIRVIAAGSLIDFSLENYEFSMPVGRIEYCFMGPLTFNEFLLARGKEALIQEIKDFKFEKTWHPVIHTEILKELNHYYIVGGMPESVKRFIDSDSYLASDEVKQSILLTFQDDFSKYKKKVDTNLIKEVFLKTSKFVGKRVKYVEYSRNYSAAKIKEALDLLTKAQIITKIKNTSAQGLPLGAETNDKFNKYIFLDIGLLLTLLGLKIDELSLKDSFTFINKGSLAEQFIGQELLRLENNYIEPELFYWERAKRNSSAEIDYLDTFRNEILPIEVKSGKSGKMKSLEVFLKERSIKKAVRFYADLPEKKDLGNKEVLYSFPLYFVESFKDKI